MLIPKELILEAKSTLGEQGAFIIKDDLELERFDEKNIKGSCPFGHSDSDPSFIWNEKDNCFHCFSCGINYGIIDHYMDFYNLTYIEAIEKLFDITNTKFSFGEKGVKTKRDYKYPSRVANQDRTIAEKYLEKRRISKKTMDALDIQQDESGNLVFHYYDTNDVLSLVKYRPSRKVVKGENKMWCQKDKDTSPLLFNMNRVDFANGALLICEGELDCCAAVESGFKNAVSVPFGSNNFKWIEYNWDWLELFEKIIVWSDADEAGMKMRKEVCNRLGVWRTLFVDAPSSIEKDGEKISIKDINEMLYYEGSIKVLDLINNAKELPITGVINMADVEDFDIEKEGGLFSGLKVIDDIVYKFLFGSTMLVTGMRGSGKSTLVNQCFVCEPLRQGHDVFIYSGELSNKVLKDWIELVMAGPEKVKLKKDNDKIHIIDSEARKKMKKWYNGRIWFYENRSNDVKTILEKAVSLTRKNGVKIWILDNLSAIDLGDDDKSEYEQQKKLIVELNRLADVYNVLIIVVVHPRKLPTGQEMGSDDIAGSGKMANLAQYILSVKRFTDAEREGVQDRNGNYKKGKEPFQENVQVTIMKNRYTGEVGSKKMFFHYCSYRFFNTADELFRRYGWWDEENVPIPTLASVDDRFAIPSFLGDN